MLFKVLLIIVHLMLSTASHKYEDTFINCIRTIKPRVAKPSEIYFGGFRSLDGATNNLLKTNLGAAVTPFKRELHPNYDNYKSLDTPRGHPHAQSPYPPPTAHEVSRAIFKVTHSPVQNKNKLSTLYMTFGQFIDHDMTLAPHEECNVTDCGPAETKMYPCFPIKFNNQGDKCTSFARATPACKSHPFANEPREQVNNLTSFLDLSQVYSVSKEKSEKLRKNDGSGELRVTYNDMLPIDFDESDKKKCKNPDKEKCHLVGDKRGEENIALYSMHTLWVREHNRIAKKLKEVNPHWNDDQLYNHARKIAGAIYQNIVYKEYLPQLIHLHSYKKYDQNVDPSISNGFAAAAFRYGHSLVPNSFSQLDSGFNKIYDDMLLQSTFFNTTQITKYGIEPTIMGLCGNMSNEVDRSFSHGIARKLFIAHGHSGYADLMALNIQRGRDHGIPTYGEWRIKCGFPEIRRFSDLENIMQEGAAEAFSKIYYHPYEIDLFAAGISEKHIPGKVIGPIFQCLIEKQFRSLRDGDRYFYKNPGVFTKPQLVEIQKMKLGKVICNNAKGAVSIQDEVFQVFTGDTVRRVCSSFSDIDFRAWKEVYPHPFLMKY